MSNRPYTILAHLPMLRLRSERVVLPDKDFWRMPFDAYNELTAGAFVSLRSEYEKCAPVFLQVSTEIPDNVPSSEIESMPNGVLEMRSQESAYKCLSSMGFQDAAFQIRMNWTLIALTFPSLRCPDPGLSQFFILPLEGKLQFANVSGTYGCVQGPADHEYVFLNQSGNRALGKRDFSGVSDTWRFVQASFREPDIWYAIERFLESLSPVFGPRERTTLAVTALESLVMPEIRENLGETFTRRLTNLLKDDLGGLALAAAGRSLYAARSEELHGMPPPSDADAQSGDEALIAASTLSMAILQFARRVGTGKNLREIQSDLDASTPLLPVKAEIALSKRRRGGAGLDEVHLPRRITSCMGENTLGTPKGKAASWSPLAGLEARDWVPVSTREDSRILIAPLNGFEILTLEEKETRSDFASQIGIIEDDRIAGFFIPLPDRDYLSPPDMNSLNAGIRRSVQLRNLGVVALRVAGFEEFHDPESYGTAVFAEHIRFRQATVFRQTILTALFRTVTLAEKCGEPIQVITAADGERLMEIWEVLGSYSRIGANPRVDHALDLFRRSFDTLFLPPAARLRVGFVALEAMVGRFSDGFAKISTEQIIHRVADATAPEAAAWFFREGRRCRNSIAHGGESSLYDPSTLIYLRAILRAIVPVFLTAWVDPGLSDLPTPRRRFMAWLSQH